MKKIFFQINIIICFSILPTFAKDCGQPIECPSVEYPYSFCNTTTGKTDIICTKNPLTFVSENSDYEAVQTFLPVK